MMRPGVAPILSGAFLLSTLLAGRAAAQVKAPLPGSQAPDPPSAAIAPPPSTPDAPATPPSDSAASAGRQASAQPATTVPGVTVTGRDLKPCKANDQACMKAVAQEIWTRYPKQIETLCSTEQMRLTTQGFTMMNMGYDPNFINNRITPATQQLCNYGAQMKKR